MRHTADIVVIGAGIAGVSTAYHLSVRHDGGDVVMVDPRPPLTLTSDKSTECYRNWWPSQSMVDLMNRSIDIFEELATETEFGLNRNGYLFVTAREPTLAQLESQVQQGNEMGAASRLIGSEELRSGFGFLTPDAVGGMLVERAGWFRAQDLGQWMFERAREHGTKLVPASVVDIVGGTVLLSDGSTITAPNIVIAAGPMTVEVAAMAGIDLPLFSELHLKVAFKDHLGIVPRDAPMTIWSDPQRLDWTPEERAELTAMGRNELLGELPIYCHFRPEGGADSPYFVGLWEYHGEVSEPTWPLPEDPLYPEVVMRGLTTMVPDLVPYLQRLPESFVDGGYYTKTRENRPLIGPSPMEGVHLVAGMSGFGVMVSAGAADLVTRHIVGSDLPRYAGAFLLDRYDDPTYLATIDTADSGQL